MSEVDSSEENSNLNETDSQEVKHGDTDKVEVKSYSARKSYKYDDAPIIYRDVDVSRNLWILFTLLHVHALL